MKCRSTLGFIVSICMVFLMLCGSLGGAIASESDALEPITFTLYAGDVDIMQQVQLDTTETWAEIKKLTGVDLVIEYIVGYEEQQKAGLMIASGDYPDLIIPHDAFTQFRDAGALMPINDLLTEYGQTIIDLYGSDLNRMYDEEGNIYSWTPFGVNRDTETPSSGFYMANELLESYGYPVVTDPDEYFDMLIAYAQEHPTMNGGSTIAFTGPTEGWRFGFMMLGADKLMGMHNTGGNYYDPELDYEAQPRETMEHRKTYLHKLFELNQLGLLDPEMFSQTYDQYLAKIASGRVLGMFDEYWEIMDAVRNLKNNPEMMNAYPVPMPLKYEGVEEDSYMGLSTIGTAPGVCITTNCSDPVRAMQFFDRMAHDDIIKLINWGIEGVHYIINENGKLDLTDEQWEARQAIDFSEKTGVSIGVLWDFPKYMIYYEEMRDGSGYVLADYADKSIERLFTAEQQTILDAYGWDSFTEPFSDPFLSPYGYGWDITIPSDRDDLNEIKAEVDELVVNTYYSKMALASSEEEFEQVWNDLVTALGKIDRQPQIDFYTEQVRTRVENWN